MLTRKDHRSSSMTIRARLIFVALLCSALVCSLSLAAQTIAITGGKILTVSHGVIDNGTILIDNGKITALGTTVAVPAGAKVLDARGKVVTPGFFDGGDLLGLVEIPAEQITVDSTEYTDPVHPELRVL